MISPNIFYNKKGNLFSKNTLRGEERTNRQAELPHTSQQQRLRHFFNLTNKWKNIY
jgi:hypothetical protein